MLPAIALALAAFSFAVLCHDECLRFLTAAIDRLPGAGRRRLLLILPGLPVAHLIEIGGYISAFALGVHGLASGTFGGSAGGLGVTLFDMPCFSIAAFTSLGMGDLYPTGALRLIAGFETLNGLLLIGWSASFTYLAMERFWRLDGERAERAATVQAAWAPERPAGRRRAPAAVQ